MIHRVRTHCTAFVEASCPNAVTATKRQARVEENSSGRWVELDDHAAGRIGRSNEFDLCAPNAVFRPGLVPLCLRWIPTTSQSYRTQACTLALEKASGPEVEQTAEFDLYGRWIAKSICDVRYRTIEFTLRAVVYPS